jgi:hypothetical protein
MIRLEHDTRAFRTIGKQYRRFGQNPYVSLYPEFMRCS